MPELEQLQNDAAYWLQSAIQDVPKHPDPFPIQNQVLRATNAIAAYTIALASSQQTPNLETKPDDLPQETP